MDSLSLKGIVIDGNGIHVSDKSFCYGRSPCCNFSAYSDPNNLCFLKEKYFSSLEKNSFGGLFILESNNSKLMLSNVKIKNFYAINNYFSLIHDKYLSSNIILALVEVDNVFFTNGVIYYFNSQASIIDQFNFNSSSLSISKWNYFKIKIENTDSELFALADTQESIEFIFIFMRGKNIKFYNTTIYEVTTNFIFLVKESNIIFESTNIQFFFGLIFNFLNSEIYISKIMIKDSGNNDTYFLFIRGNYLSLTIENAIIKNISAYCIYVYSMSHIKIFDLFLDNLSALSIFDSDDYGASFISSDRNNYVYIENVIITNVWTDYVSLINDYYPEPPLNFTIKNSYFSNISIISGFHFLIEYSTMFIYNLTLENINCTYSIFRDNHPTVYLNVNSSLFFNIRGGTIGPILIASYPGAHVKFDYLTIMHIYAGKFVFLGINGDLLFNFSNINFEYIFFEFGYFISLFENQSFYITNSSFKNFYYESPSTFDGIFLSNGGLINIESTLFSYFQIPFGSGDFIFARETFIFINNSNFENNYIYGKGGIRSWNSSGIYLISTIFQSCINDKEGILQFIDSTVIQINSSSFFKIRSLKYSVFFIKNFESLTIHNCNFQKNIADFEFSVFWITNQISLPNENSSFIISDCFFEENSQINGGVISFESVTIPIKIRNCFFNVSNIETGGFIYLLSIKNISIEDSKFKLATVTYLGGAVYMIDIAFIYVKNCIFLENIIVDGEYGGNLYIENSNALIELATFQGFSSNKNLRTSQKGSAIFALLRKGSNTFQLNDCSFYNFFQKSDLIRIESLNAVDLLIENMVFFGIYSTEGNGILTCFNCKLDSRNLTITNSFSIFAIIEISNNMDTNLSIFDFSFINCSYEENGNFLKLTQNFESIDINNGKFIANFYRNSFIYVQSSPKTNLSNIYCNENRANSQNIISNSLLEINEGKVIYLNIFRFNDSDSSFLTTYCEIININNIYIENSTQQYLEKFMEIRSSNSLNISNFTIKNSNLGIIYGFSKYTNLEKIYLNGIQLTNSDKNELFNLEYEYNQGSAFIDLFESFNTTSLMKIKNFQSLIMQNVILNNAISTKICTGINMIMISNMQINNVNFYNLSENGLIIQQNNANNPFSKINIANSIFVSCGKLETSIGAAINITGNLDAIFENLTFNYNMALKWSAFTLYSWTNVSNFKLNNCNFFENKAANDLDGSIIIPKEEFYQEFISENELLIQKINISSFPTKVKTIINGNVILLDSIIQAYSGEEVNIKLEVLDHFNQTVPSFPNLRVEIKHSNPNIMLVNYETFFFNGIAEFPKFYILIPPENISNTSYILEIDYLNKNGIILQNFPIKIKLQIKQCDTGRIIFSNYCFACSDNTYSLVEKPTSKEICHPCTSNAKCLSKTIIPNFGYWNFKRESDKIIKCKNFDSCSIVFLNGTTIKTCSEGYFGNMCNECQANYGKTVTKKCIECTESEIVLQIFLFFIKSIFLSSLIFIQYRLCIKDNENNRILINLLNVFLQHTFLFSLLMSFQDKFSEIEEIFLLIQSILTFKEDNFVLVNCLFPDISKISLYYLIFVYFVVIVSVHFIFLIGISIIHRYISKKREAVRFFDLLCLCGYNNSIIFFQYFLGLICPLFLDDSKYPFSAKFTELKFDDFNFFTILFLLSLEGLLLCIVGGFLFIKKKAIPSIVFLESQYTKNFEKIAVINFIIALFSIIASEYSYFMYAYPIIMKNIVAILFIIFLSFEVVSSKFIQFFKMLSVLIFIVFYTLNFYFVIFLNCLFYALLVGFCCYQKSLSGK